MLKAKISEIFQSIQGEGKYAGVKQVFVRFYQCNMHCDWCDTPNAIGDKPGHFEEYTPEELLLKIKPLLPGCHSVSLTGGEPLMQKDFIKAFLPLLKEVKIKTYLETNGVLPNELKEIVNDLDTIAMDVKLPSSTKCRAYWQEHKEFLKAAQGRDIFIKAVVTSDTTQEDVLEAARLVSAINPDTLFILQPNYFEIKNGAVVKCRAFQDDCLKHLTNVRVMPQMHKFMKLR